jgi:hypothetical protein
MMKVTVWYFVSENHKIMTINLLVVFFLVWLELT